MLEQTLRQARSVRLLAGSSMLAIDKHLIKRYDKKPNLLQLIKSKFFRGTSNFEAYIAGYLLNDKIGCHVAAIPVTRADFNADLVRKITKKSKKITGSISLMLLDREFYSVDVMNSIDGEWLRFLMPAVRNKGVKKAIKEYSEGLRPEVSEYVPKPADGPAFTFNLVIMPKDGSPGEHMVFAKHPGRSGP